MSDLLNLNILENIKNDPMLYNWSWKDKDDVEHILGDYVFNDLQNNTTKTDISKLTKKSKKKSKKKRQKNK